MDAKVTFNLCIINGIKFSLPMALSCQFTRAQKTPDWQSTFFLCFGWSRRFIPLCKHLSLPHGSHKHSTLQRFSLLGFVGYQHQQSFWFLGNSKRVNDTEKEKQVKHTVREKWKAQVKGGRRVVLERTEQRFFLPEPCWTPVSTIGFL